MAGLAEAITRALEARKQQIQNENQSKPQAQQDAEKQQQLLAYQKAKNVLGYGDKKE